MKKLLLFAMVLMAIAFKAQTQEEEIKQLSNLVSLAKDNPAKKDSAIVQMMVLKAKTKNPIVAEYSKKAIDTFNELSELQKNVISAKSINELSKDDLKNFKVNDDKFKEITFIHHKRESGILYNYLSLKNGFLNMRLVASYSGKSWVFFDKVIILADGSKYEIPFEETDRTVGSGYVYEVGDIRATPEIIEILRKIASSSLVEIRFSGKYQDDQKLGKYPHQVIKETLELYDK